MSTEFALNAVRILVALAFAILLLGWIGDVLS
jgi:hypothetical protein